MSKAETEMPGTCGAVFAYVAMKDCGCLGHAVTHQRLVDVIGEEFFRERWLRGEVRLVMTRDEWNAIPFRCEKCKRRPVSDDTDS